MGQDDRDHILWSKYSTLVLGRIVAPIPRSSSATDQQLQEEALCLKEKTVSIASRYEQPISQAPSDVHVITDEDIRNSGATDIPPLLPQVPGMEVMQTNALDFNVSGRGNNQLFANKLLVQVDGRSIYVDQAGIVFWKQLPVALMGIKRIEVLKGPASDVYGFNAFDGVVNIITKSPGEIKGTTLQVADGEIGTLLTNAVQYWYTHATAKFIGLTDRFGKTHQEFSLNTYDLETRYRFKPLETLSLNVGANYRRIVSSSNMLDNRTGENRLGLYAQGDWQVLPSLEISTGLRYDLASFITPTLSPRGAIVYHLNSNHTLRLSSALAYRPPTTNDVGLSALNPVTLPGSPPVATAILGSSDVKPEQIISYEVGYQGWWWEHRLRTRVTGFYNHILDLITFRNPSAPDERRCS